MGLWEIYRVERRQPFCGSHTLSLTFCRLIAGRPASTSLSPESFLSFPDSWAIKDSGFCKTLTH